MPFATKYYSRKTRQSEVAGWRTAGNSPKHPFHLTIQSPSRVHSRAQLNSPPRYPREFKAPQSASVPVLPKVPPVLRAPCSPRTTRLVLQLETLEGTLREVRLPTMMRKSNLEKSDRLSRLQGYEENRMSNVGNSSEGIAKLKVKNLHIPGSIETSRTISSPFGRSEIPSTRASQPSSPRSPFERASVGGIGETSELPILAAAVQEVLQAHSSLQLPEEIASKALPSDHSDSYQEDRENYADFPRTENKEGYLLCDLENPTQFIDNVEANADPESDSSSRLELSKRVSRSSGRQKPAIRIPAASLAQPAASELPSFLEPASLVSVPDAVFLPSGVEIAKQSEAIVPQEEGKHSPGKDAQLHASEKIAKPVASPRAYLKKSKQKEGKETTEKVNLHLPAEQSKEDTYIAKEKRGSAGKKSQQAQKRSDKSAASLGNTSNPPKATFSQAATESLETLSKRKNSHENESPRTPTSLSSKVASSPSTISKQDEAAAARAIPEQSDESKRSSPSELSEVDLYSDTFLSPFHPSRQIAKKNPSLRPRKMTLPVELASKLSAEMSSKNPFSPKAKIRRASVAFDHASQLKSFSGKEHQSTLKQHKLQEESQEISAEMSPASSQSTGNQVFPRPPTKPRPKFNSRPGRRIYIRTKIVDFASVGAADPFDLFLRELAHSLLYMIEDVIEDQDRGEKPPNSEESSALERFLKNSHGNVSMLGLLRPTKPTVSLTTSPKGPSEHAKKQAIAAAKKQELSEVNSSSSGEEDDWMSSDDEHELHKLQRQRNKMADYELKHLSMLKKIAEDLLKGSEEAESCDQMAILPLPTLEEKGRGWERQGLGDVDFSFASEDAELGGRVHDLLTDMFAGYSQEEFSTFMASHASGLQHQPTQKEEGFTDAIEQDADNYQSEVLRRHFQAICHTFGPEHFSALEEWKSTLFQMEPRQLLPIELMRLLRNGFLKKKNRLQVNKQREGQVFVRLNAKPTKTFTNLQASHLPDRLKAPTDSFNSIQSPQKRPMTERSYSERVYMRMKRAGPDSTFHKPRSRPNGTVFAAVSEQL